MQIEWDIEQEILVSVTGEFTPGEEDIGVGYHSDGEVEDVKVHLGKINITSQLGPMELERITEQFLDYCQECVGADD